MNDQNPQVQYVRQPVAPPPDVLYAHKLGRGKLTAEQVDQLVLAINPAYVAGKQGKSYLAQHQARAEMNRIFGYGNWDGEALEAHLMYEYTEKGTGNKASTDYWVTGYRVLYRVTVRDLWGMPIATYTEWHAEENAKLPNRGEAHAFALTSCESYALRRALINLGDRFGLGLYNGGSTGQHGFYTVQQSMYQWVDAANQQQVRRAEMPVTHQTIPAEQAIADDEASNFQLANPEGAQAPAAAAAKPRAPRQTAAQKRENFQQAAAQVQEGNMQARIQAGMKVDSAPEDHPADEYAGPSDIR